MTEILLTRDTVSVNVKKFRAWWMKNHLDAYGRWYSLRLGIASVMLFGFLVMTIFTFWSPNTVLYVVGMAAAVAGFVLLIPLTKMEMRWRKRWAKEGCEHKEAVLPPEGMELRPEPGFVIASCADCGADVRMPDDKRPPIGDEAADPSLGYVIVEQSWKELDSAHELSIQAKGPVGAPKDTFFGVCSCGWRGPRRSTSQEAAHDGMHHKREVMGE